MPTIESPVREMPDTSAPAIREVPSRRRVEVHRTVELRVSPAILRQIEEEKQEENPELCWLTNTQVIVRLSHMGDRHLRNTIRMLVIDKYGIVTRPGYWPNWELAGHFTRHEWIGFLRAEGRRRGIVTE